MTNSEACRSLYVHVPFCRARCGYCDFYSDVLTPPAIQPLVQALKLELEHHAAARPLALDAVFVGGGTPTVLPPAMLADLLSAIRPHLAADGEIEFTVEANPATVTPEVAGVLTEAGVSRVSIGAQSFSPKELGVLDRLHTPAQVRETVEICRQAGLTQISLDLIFGIPTQTVASWQRTIQAALDLQPDHLSCYGLTYEPATALHAAREAGSVVPVDEDVEAEMYELIVDTLPAAGLQQYEISNFARPGYACRHNVHCWDNQPYVGVGPSAAGYLDGVRYRNVADTAAYVEAVAAGHSPRAEEERLSDTERLHESAMLALRTMHGIDRAAFLARYGVDPLNAFADAISRHIDRGLLSVDDGRIHLTRRGLLLANVVMADFL